MRGAQHETPAAAGGLDLLFGDRWVDGAADEAALDEQRTDLGQQRDRLGQGTAACVGLHAGVVELRAAADGGARHVDRDGVAGGVEVDRPHHGGAYLVGQQARGALGERAGMQRHVAVGQVHRLAPAPRLVGERTPRRDVRGDVGDRVVHAIPAAGAARQAHRLVQIHRRRWINGDERERGVVGTGQRRRSRGHPVRFRLRRGREPLRQFQLAAQGAEVDAGRYDASDHHASVIPAPRADAISCPGYRDAARAVVVDRFAGALVAAVVFLAVVFFAAVAFLAVPVVFFAAVVFLAVVFFAAAVVFFAVDLVAAVVFLAVVFLAAVAFLAGAVFFAVVFFAAVFLAGAALAVVFFAAPVVLLVAVAVFFAALARPVAVFFAGVGWAATVFFAAARFAAGVVVAFFATAIMSLLTGTSFRSPVPGPPDGAGVTGPRLTSGRLRLPTPRCVRPPGPAPAPPARRCRRARAGAVRHTRCRPSRRGCGAGTSSTYGPLRCYS